MSEEKKEKPRPKTPANEPPWTPDKTQVHTVELGEPPKKGESKRKIDKKSEEK